MHLLSFPWLVLFANATRFYYLFQHHTTPERATQHGMIRGVHPACHHIVTTLGKDIALLSLDARGERTKHDVCQPKSYDILFDALYRQIPGSVKHLLVLTGVPLIYPRLTLFEKAMDGAAGFNLATIAGKTGALGDIINGQLNKWNGDPELLDDMNDRKWRQEKGGFFTHLFPLLSVPSDWTAGNHVVERKRFIERLQQYARERSVRVSFLGGDVRGSTERRMIGHWPFCFVIGALLWRWATVFQGHEAKRRRRSPFHGTNHIKCHSQHVSLLSKSQGNTNKHFCTHFYLVRHLKPYWPSSIKTHPM